jgi:hypothetical protein
MSISQLISYCKPTGKNLVFVDLGSGLGKGVVTAAMSYQFSECIGIGKLKYIEVDVSYSSRKFFTKSSSDH